MAGLVLKQVKWLIPADAWLEKEHIGAWCFLTIGIFHAPTTVRYPCQQSMGTLHAVF